MKDGKKKDERLQQLTNNVTSFKKNTLYPIINSDLFKKAIQAQPEA